MDREELAIVAFARWRNSVMARTLLAFMVVGSLTGVLGYFFVRAQRLALWHVNVAWWSGAIGFAIPFLALAFAGRLLGRRIVTARTPAQLDRLARQYGVAREAIADIAGLSAGF